MKIIYRSIASTLLLVVFGTASAYELGTHGRLTYQAYKDSVLSDPQLLSELGIENGTNPFGEVYYDVSGNTVLERTRQPFEQQAARMPEGVEPRSVEGWLMRGAIREDDLGQIAGINVGDDPHDDPYGNIFRVFNHFYDPVLNRPLTTIAGVLGQNAPDWGTGSANAFAMPNTPDTNRRNHFTVFDARESMYRALTGRDSQGNELKPAGTLTKPKDIRNAYWATTFRALGDIVHLVEDMAQPQHTRNDAHSGVPGFGHESVYEAYIEARATGASFFNIDGTYAPIQSLNYNSGYPATTFNTYSDFWSTRTGITGGGLADYSNRGFFSAGTNLGSNDYLSPSNDPNDYTKESTAGLLPKRLLEKINFLRGGVDGTTNIRMTTEGLFDFFLFSTKPSYSLNRFNYDDMAGLLIPRAVGYSAGLINYFFRGKLDFVPDTADPSKYVIKNLGKEEMSGTFTLYYDDKDDNRQPVPGAQWTNLTIAAGKDSTPVYFTPPTNPAPKADGEYMLVFKGTLGQETNAVVGHWVEPPLVVVGQSGNQAFRQTLIKRGGVWVKGKMEGLGFLSGASYSTATGVSANGSVVVGYSGNQAFRWTRAEGMVGLGFMALRNFGSTAPDYYSGAFDISADGKVIVGYGNSPNVYDSEAFRWTQADGMVGIGFLGDPTKQNNIYSAAYGISDDGKVIVGVGRQIFNVVPQAFRWTAAGGMAPLGVLPHLPGSPSTDASWAYKTSADGNIVVGESNQQAFYWTQAEGLVGLEFLGSVSNGDVNYASDISDDGSVIVGGFSTADGTNRKALCWIKAGGITRLKSLSGTTYSEANGVSPDGSIIVGMSDYEAVIWTQEGDIMTRLGFLPGASNSVAFDISAIN